MAELSTQFLSPKTWPAFVRLAEKHNGIFGGCWCMYYHLDQGWGRRTGAQNRADKERLVRLGQAHAAVVFDGPEAVGFCQFGPLRELPRIKNRRAYEAGSPERPDWRITCFFVDRHRRGQGVARVALASALAEIGRQGGGVVEAYPDNVEGRRVPGAFLWAGTLPMFEREGFERVRPIGKNNWVVRRSVAPVRARRSTGRRSSTAPPGRGARPPRRAAVAIIK
jgi:GNAT superfamily N-acetyltransferase